MSKGETLEGLLERLDRRLRARALRAAAERPENLYWVLVYLNLVQDLRSRIAA